MKWSILVEGIVEGTPLIGRDRSRIYVIHNTGLHAMLTVLESDGTLLVKLTDLQPMARYGPASMVSINGIDELYWADAHDWGYATRFRLFTIVSDSLQTNDTRSLASISMVAPTISTDGKSIWLGGRGATVHGWDGRSLKPAWSTRLKRSLRNESFRKCLEMLEKKKNENAIICSSHLLFILFLWQPLLIQSRRMTMNHASLSPRPALHSTASMHKKETSFGRKIASLESSCLGASILQPTMSYTRLNNSVELSLSMMLRQASATQSSGVRKSLGIRFAKTVSRLTFPLQLTVPPCSMVMSMVG